VPESAIEAIGKARENGHEVFLCTGRCRAFIPHVVRKIKLDGMVAGCGTSIYYRGKQLVRKRMAQELQRDIAKDLIDLHLDGILEGDGHCYFRDQPFVEIVKTFSKSNAKYGENCILSFQQEDKLSFDKFCVWYDETGDIETFKKKYEDIFEFIDRADDFYEVVPRGYSKATGIEYLCQLTGVSRKNTISIGDSANDLSMLGYTGISVAMGDGNPELFERVDYVTTGVAQDGIKNALEHYHLI